MEHLDTPDERSASRRRPGIWGLMPFFLATALLVAAVYFVMLKDSDWHPPGLFPTSTKGGAS